MPSPTTLVLGAGASHGHGFPVGSQLRTQLLSLGENTNLQEFLGYGMGTIRGFVRTFRESQLFSIDAFLGRRLDFANVGKAAIAHLLLQSEQNTNLFGDNNTDPWYQYLVNLLARDPWDEFDPSWLSIVTFNYDRSLETYLLLSLCSIYDKNAAQVVERLSRMQIVHVYGSLGSPWPGQHDSLRFGATGEEPGAYVAQAANRIKVIPEGRDDEPTLQAAQQLLLRAQKICFLGFGFDETNVRRLGAPNFANNVTGKSIAGTVSGLRTAEIARVRDVLARENGRNLLLHPMHCLDLLRETQILEPWV